MIQQQKVKTEPQAIQRKPVSQIMAKLLQQNPNNIDIKRQIKQFTDVIQKRYYIGFTENQEQYLQAYGLHNHEAEHFNYINQLLHTRTNQFLDKVAQSQIEVKSTIPPPPPPPPKISQQIVQEVQHVLNNIDLPLSLFKRDDNYWSQDNAKTIQTKEYLKELHQQDRKWKQELKRKRQQILNQKNELYHKNVEEASKQEKKMKQQQRLKMIKKIEQIKLQAGARTKTIEESLDFMKKQGKPMYKKMEEQFYNRVQLPTLQQKKRKLSQIRQLRRSVDLIQIQQHTQKYKKIKNEHQGVKIVNQPVKISYKGKFYQELQKSNVSQITQSRAKSLFQKRNQYAQSIRQNYMPTVSQAKANQVAERIAQMNKRFKRPKRKLKKMAAEEDQEDQDEEQEEQQPQPQPQPQQQEDQQDQDDDDELKIKEPKDDQYEPTHIERYKMGLKFLQEAKLKRRYKHQQKEENDSVVKQIKNKSFSIKNVHQIKQMQMIDANSIAPISISNQSSRKIKYRNYLQEMSKTNKTIDFIDTSRLKNDLTTDNKIKNQVKIQQLQNKIRNIQQKAKQQQQLLKHKKLKKNQKIDKKLQLDNAIVDTIKARLAMLNN